MKKLVYLLSVLLIALATGANAQTESQSKKSLAWSLGADLSLAGALHAQPGDNKAYQTKYFAKAKFSASALGITIPNLPAKTGDRTDDSAAVLEYLLNSVGVPVIKILKQRLGDEHAAIFEISLKANILYFMYAPGDSITVGIANVIRKVRPISRLPDSMTDLLLGLVQKQASYEQIKSELNSLQDIAPTFIAVIEFTENGGPEYYFGRARAYLQLGKNIEAIADYTKVIQLKGSSATVARNLPLVYYNRGICYGLISKNTFAIADLTNAIKLKPDYASAYKVRGLVYKKMGNAAHSNADLQTAERLHPGITR